MANYSLVINSRFKPFSYQELLQPALMSTQAHQAVEEAYADLSTKASIWDKMANESTDPKAHAIYKKYADDLQAQSEELSRYGLTPASRQSMLNMRSRYARDITPIETAYKRREEQIKQQNAILAQDPTHMFARRAAETSLDAFLEQPTLDTIAQNYSGSLLTKQVSDAAAALAKDARNDPNVQTELRKLLPYQYETIRRTGFAPEAVRQAILNSPNADKILTGLVDTAMANSGMNDWNYTSPEEKARIIAQARNYANQGLWSAVGQTQYGSVSDSYGMQSALEAQRHRHAMAEAAAKAAPQPSSEPRRGWNFLETNGTLAAYDSLHGKLTTKGGALKASYFGKKYANPLKVYEEAERAYNNALRKSPAYSKRDLSRPIRGGASSMSGMAETGMGESNVAAAIAARNAVLKKYGVTEVLSQADYKHLKDLGYTNASTYSDFRNGYSTKVNERASQWRHESVNLNETALKERGNTLSGYLKFMQDRDKLDGIVYAVNSDGTQGDAIKDLGDVGIKDLSKATLNDVFYARQVPDKLHIQYGGADMYVNPNAFGAEVASLVRQSNALLQMNDAQIKNAISRMYGLSPDTFTAEQARDFVAQDTKEQLKDILRGYGKGRTDTDSKI